MRIFLAFDPDKSYLEASTRLQKELNKQGISGRTVKPEAMHMTVLFLGEQSEEDIDSFCGMTAGLSLKKFKLEPFGLETFGKPPKVLFLGFKRGKGLQQYQSVVQDVLDISLFTLSAYQPDTKESVPHLTVMRFKKPGEGASLSKRDKLKSIWKQALKGFKLPPLFCDQLTLYKSTLTPDGPVYEPLKQFKLQ